MIARLILITVSLVALLVTFTYSCSMRGMKPSKESGRGVASIRVGKSPIEALQASHKGSSKPESHARKRFRTERKIDLQIVGLDRKAIPGVTVFCQWSNSKGMSIKSPCSRSDDRGLCQVRTSVEAAALRFTVDQPYSIASGAILDTGAVGASLKKLDLTHRIMLCRSQLSVTGRLLDTEGTPIVGVEVQARISWTKSMIDAAVPLWKIMPFAWKKRVDSISFTGPRGEFILPVTSGKSIHLGSAGWSRREMVCEPFHSSQCYEAGQTNIILRARRLPCLTIELTNASNSGAPVEDYSIYWYLRGSSNPFCRKGHFANGVARIAIGAGPKDLRIVPKDTSLRIVEIDDHVGNRGVLSVKTLRRAEVHIRLAANGDSAPLEGQVVVLDCSRLVRPFTDYSLQNSTDYYLAWTNSSNQVRSESIPWLKLPRGKSITARVIGRYGIHDNSVSVFRPRGRRCIALVQAKRCLPKVVELENGRSSLFVKLEPCIDQTFVLSGDGLDGYRDRRIEIRHASQPEGADGGWYGRVLDFKRRKRLLAKRLAPGRYDAYFRGRRIRQGMRLPSPDRKDMLLDLRLVQPAIVAGHVALSKQCVGALEVGLLPEGSGASWTSKKALPITGDFSFGEVVPGTYSIRLRVKGPNGDVRSMPGSLPFEVKPGDHLYRELTVSWRSITVVLESEGGASLVGRKIRVEGDPSFREDRIIGSGGGVPLRYAPTQRVRFVLLPDLRDWAAVVKNQGNKDFFKSIVSRWYDMRTHVEGSHLEVRF